MLINAHQITVKVSNLLSNTTCLKLTILLHQNTYITWDINATGMVLSDDMRTSIAGRRRVIGNQGSVETMAEVKYCVV